MDEFDRYAKVRENVRNRMKTIDDKCDAERRKSMKENKSNNFINYDLHKGHDSIYTMSNTEATILYVVVMLGSLIFKDKLLIWAVASIVYYLHMTRHTRK